ncbi:LAFA_0G11760g1_1 [Lachancea sp. 'fantastica']|nr:LAFA_0G11760g1_1 [Lachancea sp. 'fantastica']
MSSEGPKISSGSTKKNPLKQLFNKFRVGLHQFSREALESDSVEEVGSVNELFDSGNNRGKSGAVQQEQRRSEERNSSTSVTLNREIALTDEDEDDDELERDSNGEEGSGDAGRKDQQTFATYNAVEECVKLRSKFGEPFVQADRIWRRRRELWCKPTDNAQLAVAARNRERFEEIAPRHYVRVYRKLVVDGVPLKRALNLQDAVRVINAGWVETQKWERAAKGLA